MLNPEPTGGEPLTPDAAIARLHDLARRLARGERGRRSIPVRLVYDDDMLLCNVADMLARLSASAPEKQGEPLTRASR